MRLYLSSTCVSFTKETQLLKKSLIGMMLKVSRLYKYPYRT
uniref:Uncharacterized protein n=1 Tax=Lepeophtheirus salmonis TaxID=72036 RepID=A0A0K2SW44_LEPSM